MMRALVLPMLMMLATAAVPPDGASPAAQPGFDVNSQPVALPQPKKDAPIDPVVAQLIVARLVELHLLASAAEAQEPTKLGDAVRGFQSGIGIKATGLLDRKTIALMAL